MAYAPDDLIVAIASPPGGGERGILRLSGAGVRDCLQQLLGPACPSSEHWSGRATRWTGLLPVGLDDTALPAAIYIWPDSRSYTGQPAAEIHTIGSPPLLEDLLARLCRVGARLAEPGEFTLRAFLSGKIDLVQAEAVLAVIDADNQQQLSQALSQLAGGISREIAALRESLLIDLADLEAGLDFVDEDLEFVTRPEFIARLRQGVAFVERILATTTQRGRSDSRFRIVLAGAPNAGKSTLFNALVGREAAITSHVAGTTRDYLTADVDWSGSALTLVDTAGIEESTQHVMQQASELRHDQQNRADLVLWCQAANDDAGTTWQEPPGDARSAAPAATLTIVTKLDQCSSQLPTGGSPDAVQSCCCGVSALSGAGLDELRTLLIQASRAARRGRGELLASTSARCLESLEQAHAALGRSLSLAEAGSGDELIALELRSTLDALGRVGGQVSTDDLLDRIFSRFCIGK